MTFQSLPKNRKNTRPSTGSSSSTNSQVRVREGSRLSITSRTATTAQ